MNQERAQSPEYIYPDSFLRRKKIIKTLAPIILLAVTITAGAIVKLTPLGSYSYESVTIVIFAALVWFFCFSDAFRNFNGDRLTMRDGTLCFEKCMVQKGRTHYEGYTVKNVGRVEAGTRYIKIYGAILYTNGARIAMHRTLRLSAKIKNAEEIIRFAKSIQTADPQVIQDSFEKFHGKKADTSISRAEIWACMSKLFISLYITKVLGGLLLAAFSSVFMFAIINGFDNIFMILLFVGFLMIGLIISGVTFLALILVYLPDLLFKRVCVYDGVLKSISPIISSTSKIRYQNSHYKGYYNVTLYEKPDAGDDYTRLPTGEIKSSPNGVQRFIVRGRTLFDGAGDEQTFEVLYLKKTRIIAATRRTDM